MSKQSLTLTELMNEPTNRITFWTTSTDVICPAESPHAYKGTARHISHSQVWDLVGSHCPRCNDDWNRAKDGLRPCLSRECYTWKQTGKHTTPPPMSEEDIVFSEFEDDLHEEIANDIEHRAKENVNNLPSTGDNMSDSRDDEIPDMVFDEIPDMVFDETTIPKRYQSHSRPTEEGEITEEKI